MRASPNERPPELWRDLLTRSKAEVSAPISAEDCLARALAAGSAPARARWARRGLALDADDLAPDTEVLLLRQIYLAHLEAHRYREAAEVAERMAAIGPLRDVAYHDAARARAAAGQLQAAIAAQRLAARHAPAARRSFQLWCLAHLLEQYGDLTGALRALERAQRWAHHDRALIRAQDAYFRLKHGLAAAGLQRTVQELQKSPAREGYGQWLLGMLAHELGDRRKAAAHLRAFLRRHAAADEAKAITLREELHAARRVLAEIESD